MASVRKRKWVAPDGADREAWIVAYTDQGGKRRLKTFDKKKDADRYRTQVETEVEKGIHTPDSESITVREACARYLDICERRYREKDGIARTTLAARRGIIRKHIDPLIGNVKLSRLSAPMVQEWVDGLRADKDDPRSPWIMAHILQCFRQAITEAQRSGLVARNVVKEAPPRVAAMPSERLEIPTKEEVRRVLEIAETAIIGMGEVGRACLAAEIAVFTGMREGEIFALMWSNVDFEKRIIRVRHSANRWGDIKEPKSRAGVRDVPIPPMLLKKLKEWKLASKPNRKGLVLASRNGTPLSTPNFHKTEWPRLLGQAKLLTSEGRNRYHFHALRHFAASLFIEQGLPPKRVQYLMGHASITITFDRYGHLFPGDGLEEAAATAIESSLRG
ncbi:Site-specific recombinase XerD [Faunimonas pinastri]|uniref:Site-specific recombinase XerD n=1 Tax=Faunimonas pinastri TaxID=1855383 RepID=A0A1H9QAC2_9HYPH|nr:site-specific integrase [Faunimonas pinastri]SER57390.1 Site-specific recombinase XerD [Faunimonas pinastri]